MDLEKTTEENSNQKKENAKAKFIEATNSELTS